jgi:hypothetical protein
VRKNQSDNRSVSSPLTSESTPQPGGDATSQPSHPFFIGQEFRPFGLFRGAFVPEAVCRCRCLSMGAKLVFGRLCRFAGADGRAFPSVATLGAELGISAQQARRYIRELEVEHFIAAKRQPGRSSRYAFLWHAVFETPLPHMGVPPLPHMGAEESQVNESQLQAGAVVTSGSVEPPKPSPACKLTPNAEPSPAASIPEAQRCIAVALEEHAAAIGKTVDAALVRQIAAAAGGNSRAAASLIAKLCLRRYGPQATPRRTWPETLAYWVTVVREELAPRGPQDAPRAVERIVTHGRPPQIASRPPLRHVAASHRVPLVPDSARSGGLCRAGDSGILARLLARAGCTAG